MKINFITKMIVVLTCISICIGSFSVVAADDGTVNYVYDDLNRLVRVEYSDGTVITYTYDEVGNRIGYEVTVTSHKGDFDGNGCIELYDFVEFAGAFGSQTGDPDYNTAGDFDDNGKIELYDFVEFAEVFGTCY